ncbi:MAG: histone deacetylase family protein [Desulfosudis oleivorans]|nr:histone deacetylase family protein [Desulfosudis oleivorans]
MNIIFHDSYYRVYDRDPAAAPGRMEPVMRELKKHPHYMFITPDAATEEDPQEAHSILHIQTIRRSPSSTRLRSSLQAARSRRLNGPWAGEPSFGCIRPPGHHASSDSCWGFCFFNNMAVSLLRLKAEGKISSAFILDFDLHYGDGNVHILDGVKNFTILNPDARNERDYLREVSSVLDSAGDYDIIAASAGFDEYVKDWGGKLSTQAYQDIGAMMKEFRRNTARETVCAPRRRVSLCGPGAQHPRLLRRLPLNREQA